MRMYITGAMVNKVARGKELLQSYIRAKQLGLLSENGPDNDDDCLELEMFEPAVPADVPPVDGAEITCTNTAVVAAAASHSNNQTHEDVAEPSETRNDVDYFDLIMKLTEQKHLVASLTKRLQDRIAIHRPHRTELLSVCEMTDIPEEIESFLQVQRTPPCRADCLYIPEKRSWIPEELISRQKKKDVIQTVPVKLIVQVSPTGIARCRACGRNVEKKQLRIGYPVADSRGDHGVLSAWVHTTCSRAVVRFLTEVTVEKNELNLHTAIWTSELSTGAMKSHPSSPDRGRTFSVLEPKKEKLEAVQQPGEFCTAEPTSLRKDEEQVPQQSSMESDETVSKNQLVNSLPSNDKSSLTTGAYLIKDGVFEVMGPTSDEAVTSEDQTASLVKAEADTQTETKEVREIRLTDPMSEGLKIVSLLFYDWDLLDYQNQINVVMFSFNLGGEQEKRNGAEFLAKMVERPVIERHPTPPEMVISLLPFQQEGLAWMCHQEQSEIKGGILADEMGMGKTIQMIALLLAQENFPASSVKPQLEGLTQQADMMSEAAARSVVSRTKENEINPKGFGSTLVIAPLAAVLQWKEEIERFTVPGSLSVLLYHGSCREALLSELHLYDVVITTYATVESDYRRVINMHKVTCKFCGRMFLPDKLAFHQRYFCGPAAAKTARQAKTQKKQKQAAAKAMKTLNIGDDDDTTFVPTISNVYRSILKEANIHPDPETIGTVPWLARRRRRSSTASSSSLIGANSPPTEAEEPPSSLSLRRRSSGDLSGNANGISAGGKKRAKPPSSNNSGKSKKPRTASTSATANEQEGIPDSYMEAFCQLLEMGFPLTESKVALEATGGDLSAASALLMSSSRENSITSINSKFDDAPLADLSDMSAGRQEKTEDDGGYFSAIPTISQPNHVSHESGVVNRDARRRVKATAFRQQLGISKTEIQKKKVAELQQLLKSIDAPSFGTKPELVNRLTLLLYPEEWIADKGGGGSLNDDDDNKQSADESQTNRMESVANESIPESNGSAVVKGKVRKPPKKNIMTDTSVNRLSALRGNSKDVPSTLPRVRPVRSCRAKLQSQKVPPELEADTLQKVLRKRASRASSSVNSKNKGKKSSKKKTCATKQELKKSSSPATECDNVVSSSSDDLFSKPDETSADTDFTDEANSSDEFLDEEKSSIQTEDDDDDLIPIVSPPKRRKKPAKQKQLPAQETSSIIFEDVNESSSMLVGNNVSSEEDDGVEIALSPLHAVVWKRIVLDEAHRIKSRTTSTAKAVYALKASSAKWCLSGTPLQNRVGELYSLIRFLKMDPFAFYYCQKKDCDCKSLHFRFKDNRFCVKCQHARLSHYSYFNRKVITPIKNYGYEYEGREGFRVLKQEILDRVLLRRTKLERAEDVNLPSLTVVIRRDKLIPAERDFYESLYKQTRTQFNTYVDEGTLLHNYAHIFDLLSRLRQAVAHPYLIIYGNLAAASMPSSSKGDSDVCGLCQDDVDDMDLVISGCKHSFHRSCIDDYINSAPEDVIGTDTRPVGCPVCYTLLTVDLGKQLKKKQTTDEQSDSSSLVDRTTGMIGKPNTSEAKRSGILSRIRMADFKPSTKMEALVQELTAIAQQDTSSKSIIFSQYTSMLELLEWRLKKGEFNCAKLVGSLSLAARSNILYAFNTNPELKIILISLKAGGEGLNLQIANNIFLMDPWWNPAVELQAIQRAHRIGQTKPVRAVRFICENTIEEKMLQLQEKKQLVFDGTVGASDVAMAKLTADDLRFLFQN